MPISKVWIYRLLFVCLFVCFCVFVCLYGYVGEDKASGVKFCTVVHGRPGQGSSHFGELWYSRSPKSDESATHHEVKFRMGRRTVIACLSSLRIVWT